MIKIYCVPVFGLVMGEADAVAPRIIRNPRQIQILGNNEQGQVVYRIASLIGTDPKKSPSIPITIQEDSPSYEINDADMLQKYREQVSGLIVPGGVVGRQ